MRLSGSSDGVLIVGNIVDVFPGIEVNNFLYIVVIISGLLVGCT